MSTFLHDPDDIDETTSKVIAELLIEDIDNTASARKARADALLLDNELAFSLQRELCETTVQSTNDYNALVQSLNDPIDAAHRGSNVAEIVKQATDDDMRAALFLLNEGQLPPLSASQRFVLDQSFSGRDAVHGMKPCYMRYNYWGEIDGSSPTLAEWSETAKPLPDLPQTELNNPVVLNTLAMLPSLVKIVTPINVEVFRELLVDHPNRGFVESVLKGLGQGFWPFADTHPGEYPDIYDMSTRMPNDPDKAQFLREQRDIEIAKERFSESFGPELYGGMYSSPSYAVPKPGPSKFRLVTDQSRGKYSPNSMIRLSDMGIPMDDMSHFGQRLIAARERSVGPLTLWKSDVAEAYRHCPMHPHFQIKQVTTIDGQRHVDRNNTSGGRASFNIWGSVMSLVMWIAKNACHIDALCFNDGTFGVSDTNDTEYYHPYNCMMPRHQCILLQLWDLLGIPHKEKKQLSGNPLTIIGIEVDVNKMTMTLPADVRDDLVAELHRVTAQPGSRFLRKEIEQLAGWVNWSFNVFPLLRPSLSNVYAEMAGTAEEILCSDPMRDDLLWGLNHIKSMDRIRILDSRAWSPNEAHLTIYTDACLESMTFWYPASKLAFWCEVPLNTPSSDIFYLEALCVTSAFLDAASRLNSPSKIVICTNNTNTVDMFSSFHAKPLYNSLLKAVADVMIAHRHQLKVLFVPEEENTVADLLSRKKFQTARQIEPSLWIKVFQPLRVARM